MQTELVTLEALVIEFIKDITTFSLVSTPKNSGRLIFLW